MSPDSIQCWLMGEFLGLDRIASLLTCITCFHPMLVDKELQTSQVLETCEVLYTIRILFHIESLRPIFYKVNHVAVKLQRNIRLNQSQKQQNGHS
ncbi:MAG: hypothetical protein A2Z14_13355 [Chloroflexi bacterium RBG_16_48_8]|nr:MAG: hypothetical protein A2Z14_13355 [Chloroflexi bacterium RBG_16_48_8]